MLENNSLQQKYNGGGSVDYCDFILKHQLGEIQPSIIVDFGAGSGKNGNIARTIFGKHVKLIAIEGFERTVQILSALSLYDEVYHSLIQNWVFKNTNQYDLAIFGDSFEHLRPKEIHVVIKQCLKRFKHIIVVSPLHDLFQDECFGNPLEIHKTYITKDFFDRYDPIEKHIIKGKEYTIINVHILSECKSKKALIRFSEYFFHKTILFLQPLGLAKPFVNFLKRHFLKYKWLIGRPIMMNKSD